MKSQRRHELKQNTLDKVLVGAPDYGRKYGGVALLVVLAAMAGYMLVRYRISSAAEAQRVASESLSTARTSINQLSQLDMYPIPAPQKAEFRKRWSDDARSAIDQVTGSSNDPKLLAEALLAKGDLNWALAQLGELPGAATQPSLRAEADPQALLTEAATAYEQVLNSFGEQKDAVLAARFGLAAVYENQGRWDQAKSQYQQIIDDKSAAEAFRTQARLRLDKASDWSQPVLLAAATQPAATAVEPATRPAVAPAMAHPTTAPAAVTGTPTTRPVER